MQRFDRYVLSQLMVLFGFFALVLVAVYWVNKAVVLFDQLIGDGYSAGVFLEFTALSLPAVIALVLPMAGFAASVYVTNRLSSGSELTVMRATGFSPWRMARPVLAFGVLIALLMSLLTHVLVPAAAEQLRLREGELSGSLSAQLLREGLFQHPSKGVTFYIREITVDGELQDVLLSDRRNPEREVTYTSQTAYLLRAEDGPKLVMVSGQAQTLQTDTAQLSTTNFSNFTLDIGGMVSAGGQKRRKLRYVPTLELLRDTSNVAEETKRTEGQVLEEAHMRFQSPLLCIVATLIGFATLIAGGFSRFGVTKQIVGAIFLLVAIKIVESAVTGPVHANAALWPLIYLPSLFGAAIAVFLLWFAARPYRPRRRQSLQVPA